MPMFLPNQLNYCHIGIHLLKNLSEIYARMANAFAASPIYMGIKVNRISTMLEQVTDKKNRYGRGLLPTASQAVVYHSDVPVEQFRAPEVLKTLYEELPKHLKTVEASEILQVLYLESISLEIYLNKLQEDFGLTETMLVSGAVPIIMGVILKNNVLSAIERLESSEQRFARLFPCFDLMFPGRLRFANLLDNGSFVTVRTNKITLEQKLKSLLYAQSQIDTLDFCH